MENLAFKKHIEKNMLLYFSFVLFIFSSLLLFNQVYLNKIKNIELFEKNGNKSIKLQNNEVSFVYIIDDYEKSKPFLQNMWTLFRASKKFNVPIYFVIKSENHSKLKSFFELNDIDQSVYLTNRLIFWKFCKGTATLLIFKRNKLAYSQSVKNLNQKSNIKNWKKIIQNK
ncbi:hypothetical protein [Alphaproteobacteria bacterium endosymbiont of Tiliacea citrago]|uniref:hypothetical protein n=1 Tax=Alphaproteobacteria bacterium endosymbiont of Tiliacea citrago TaxID=3077944 RepID=UPI00313CB48D